MQPFSDEYFFPGREIGGNCYDIMDERARLGQAVT
jgi:hypothetical protein